MAKATQSQRKYLIRQRAEREADPELMAAYKAKIKAMNDRLRAEREADPEKMEAFKARRLRDRKLYAARLAADPERAEAMKQKRRVAEPAKRGPKDSDEPRQSRPPVAKKVVPYKRNPIFDAFPIMVSSPDMTYQPPKPTSYPPVEKSEPIEPVLPPLAKREGWKPDERLQALIDASIEKERAERMQRKRR